tara:strand:+ start:339 stop:536 length:198 start_codon:yes stop_codon:yes gene_type:complete
MQENLLDENNVQSVSEDIKKTPDRVDINVLKSRIREIENKQLRKNIYILATCVSLIIIAGIYVTY